MCTVLNQPRAIVCRSRTSPQACTTCFHAPEVGHHQHHAPMSSSLKSLPSSALTDIHVSPSDYPVRPSRNNPTATMLHPASCPPRTSMHCLDALCLHDPVTTHSRLLRALYACRQPRTRSILTNSTSHRTSIREIILIQAASRTHCTHAMHTCFSVQKTPSVFVLIFHRKTPDASISNLMHRLLGLNQPRRHVPDAMHAI